MVGADPCFEDVMVVAVPLHQENGAKVLSAMQMYLLRFYRDRYQWEAGIMDARRHTDKCNDNAGIHDGDLRTVSCRSGYFLYASLRTRTWASKWHRHTIYGRGT